MTRASAPTLLALDRYAALLGLNPAHFAGGTGGDIFPQIGRCKDVWPQYAWQSDEDLISREELAMIIHTAEEDIKQALGYAVAPQWEDSEVHSFPRAARTAYPGVTTTWGKVIAPGRRAVALVDDNVTVTYSDPDADNWSELATISVATALTDANQCRVYFAGKDGLPEWEIRPLTTKVIAAGTLTITAPAWLFIEPALWEQLPTTYDFTAIDLATTANYVETVDIYREYIDSTLPSSEFLWEPANWEAGFGCSACGGSGCSVCTLTTQDGCMTVRNAESGIVTPYPATYSEDDVAWATASYSVCRAPTMVKLHYYAGAISDRYLAGRSLDPLSDYFAETVMWLASARLERPLCSCSNVQNRVDELRRDLSMSTRDTFYARYKDMSIFDNPFGTRAGEVRAWDRIAKLMGDAVWHGAAL